MKKRITITLLVTILAFLQATGCAPTPGALAPAAQTVVTSLPEAPIAQGTTTLPATFTPAATPTPTWALVSETEVWQTLAAYPTPLPLPFPGTPTSTTMPTPTFTPYPGPVWRILFNAVPCPGSTISIPDGCSLGSAYMDFVDSQEYFIDSDGSNFLPLNKTGIFLADVEYFSLPNQPLSDDGRSIAYKTLDCIFVSDPEGQNPVCVVPEADYILGRGFEFWPGSSCLLLYIQSSETTNAQVSLKKYCDENDNPELVTVVDFPELLPTSTYLLSPQGEALLALGFVNHEIRLYAKELSSDTQPILLFPRPELTLPPAWPVVRWQPDGKAIKLFFIREAALFVTISRDGTSVEQGPDLSNFYPLGGYWSPDGTEFVFSHAEVDATKSGLYVIDLLNGNIRQILSGFSTGLVGHIRTWPASIFSIERENDEEQ